MIRNELLICLLIMNEISICIARLPQVTTWKDIKYSFEKVIGVGTVDRVSIIDRCACNGASYQSAFIRFRRWPKTEQASAIRSRLMAGHRVNVVYKEGSPCFWRCTLTRS